MNAAASEQSVNTGVGGVAFVTTQWSVVLTAQGQSPSARLEVTRPASQVVLNNQ
jgi:hypothetical protein